MKGKWLLVFGALGAFCTPALGQAPAPHPFSGVYLGGAGGGVSYNTRITFDGVDDPAGRGGFGYSAFLGYNHVFDDWLLGVETILSGASVPGPYTFDPAATGFAELDLRRDPGVGLDVRAGRVVAGRVLVHGIVGYSVATQSVRLDGVPLSDFAGGSEAETFGTVQLGAGVDVPIWSRLGFRFVFRSLGGHDLSAEDFGTVVPDASLTFFDVEPGQHHFLFGFRYLL